MKGINFEFEKKQLRFKRKFWYPLTDIPNLGKAISEKYDGVSLYENEYASKGKLDEGELITKVYCCFEPNQIKLADGSNTTFDSQSDDIRYEKGGGIEKYYRAEVGEKYEKQKVETPKGFYEKVGDDGYPVIRHDEYFISDVPEIAASKNIYGAILGAASMMKFNKGIKENTPIQIYAIEEKPDIDISHWGGADFEYLSEVRYRKDVVLKHLFEYRLSGEVYRLIKDFYDYKEFEDLVKYDDQLEFDDRLDYIYKMIENHTFFKKLKLLIDKTIGNKSYAKGGEIDPKVLRERWAKKKDALENLANNIQRLRTNLYKDLKGSDDKEKLTALVIITMNETGERVGNDESADNGHLGITGLKKKNVSVNGSNIKFKYTGKSAVEHEKQINNHALASAYKEAIKNSPSDYVFETTDGFRIKNDKVNRYLNRFDVSAKDLRGYSANKWIITRLKSVKDREILGDAKKRKTKFNEIVKDVAEKVGHGRATLKKHYLLPSLEREFINHGKIVDLSNIKRTYEDGGEIDSNNSAKREIKFSEQSFENELKGLNPAIQNFISEMIENKIIQRTIKIKDPSKINMFMEDVKPAIDKKILRVEFNPIDKNELFIKLGIDAQKFIRFAKGGKTDDVKIVESKRNRNVRFTISGKAVAILEKTPLMDALDYVPYKVDKGTRKQYGYYKKEQFLKKQGLKDFDQEFWYLNFIEVKPKYRGQGVASILMKSILKWAKENDVKYLYLFSMSLDEDDGLNQKKLKRFYEKFGFKEIASDTMVKLFARGGANDDLIALPDTYAHFNRLKEILRNQGYDLTKKGMARGGDTHDEINTGFDALANLETEPLNELVDIPNDGLGIYNKGGKTQYSDGVSKLVNKESIEHIIPTFEEDDINWFKLIHSKDLINQLLENIGIPIKVKFELGEGSNGTAWMTENDTVLKLTKNGAEAYSSYIIFKNQENFTSQAEIYNIFIINDYSNVDVQSIYFIEKQFLNPFQDSKASSISHIYNDIEATATATKYSNNDRLEMLENIIRDENLSDQESIYARQVFALAKDVKKEERAYGINLRDNHSGNVGFDNSGKLLCYDCAHVGNKKLKKGGNLKNDTMETMKVGGVLNKTTEKSAIPTFVDFDIKAFSYRNIPAINKILKKLKVNIQVTKILGEGASGVAFLTNRNTVLKVTSNGEEGYVSYVIMKNQNDFKSQSKIYNVFIVFGMGEPTFFIEKEKGEVMRDSKKYSQFMDTNWRNFKEIGEDSTLYKKRKKLIDDDIDDYREAGLKVSQNDKKYALQLVDLFHNIEIDMKKNGVNLEDSHDGNVGFFDGKILCFDCAYRNPKSIDLGRLVDSSDSSSSYASGGKLSEEEKKEIYAKWRKLVNMSKSELQKFYDSEEGKQAGLTPEEAKAEGIDSGRESARWIMKMKDTKVADWTPTMWKWAKKQISFVSRMSGNKGKLLDENGKKTRKYLSLLIWGNDPNKKASGGDIEEPCHVCSMNDAQYNHLPSLGEMADGKRFVYKESVFAKGGDTMSHVGDRYLILECMGEGGITDTLNLKVIQSSSPALLVGSVINRPIRNIINKGREMGTTFGENIVGSYKKGGELNPDNKAVKNYFEHKSGSAGGLLVGKRHSEGGIKAINNSTGQPLEMEGGEVVITRDAVSDPNMVEYEGKKMTKREVLSEINQSGGGVAFADGGVVGEKNA